MLVYLIICCGTKKSLVTLTSGYYFGFSSIFITYDLQLTLLRI
jgi:hypothetical protein